MLEATWGLDLGRRGVVGSRNTTTDSATDDGGQADDSRSDHDLREQGTIEQPRMTDGGALPRPHFASSPSRLLLACLFDAEIAHARGERIAPTLDLTGDSAEYLILDGWASFVSPVVSHDTLGPLVAPGLVLTPAGRDRYTVRC